MFDVLTRISLETDVDNRRIKRKARADAYWLGHLMGRFFDNRSTCKTCGMQMTLTVDGVRGDAVEKRCIQQMLPLERIDDEKAKETHCACIDHSNT